MREILFTGFMRKTEVGKLAKLLETVVVQYTLKDCVIFYHDIMVLGPWKQTDLYFRGVMKFFPLMVKLFIYFVWLNNMLNFREYTLAETSGVYLFNEDYTFWQMILFKCGYNWSMCLILKDQE